MARGRPKKSEIIDNLNGNPGKRRRKQPIIHNRGEKTEFMLGLPNGLCQQARIRARERARYLEKHIDDLRVVRASFERWCYLEHFILESATVKKKEGVDPEKRTSEAGTMFLKSCAEARQIEDRWDKIINSQAGSEETENPFAKFAGTKLKAIK